MSTVDVVDRVVEESRISGWAALTRLIAAEVAYCRQFMRNPLPDKGLK